MSVSFQVQVDSDKEQITKIWFAGIWKGVISMTEKRGKTRKRKENKMHGGITPSTTQWLMLMMFERCLHFTFPEFNESNDSPSSIFHYVQFHRKEATFLSSISI